MSKAKVIGTRAEVQIVNYLKEEGFVHATRKTLQGKYDQGDIWINTDSQTGYPIVMLEVKGGKMAGTASMNKIQEWLQETQKEKEQSRAKYGILIKKVLGRGHPRDWLAFMTVANVPIDNPKEKTNQAVYCSYGKMINLEDKIKIGRYLLIKTTLENKADDTTVAIPFRELISLLKVT
jgi:hypothetical protein